MIRERVRRRRLEQSIAVSFAMLVVVLVGTTLVLVHSRVAGTLRTGLEARGLSMARSIGAVATPSLLAYNYPALQIAAQAAAGDDGVAYVVIHDKEGVVAGRAGRALFSASDDAGRANPVRGPRSAEVHVRSEEGSTETVLEMAAPVMVEDVDQPWGMVRVGLSYAPVEAELRRIDLGFLALGLGLAVGAVVCGRWMARKITAPLRRLAEGTEALSAGDMTHRIPVTGARELADLARAFNGMMDRVQDKARESEEFQKALEELNATLEEQVQERTQALQESEAQYKTLVEHSTDSILIIQDGRVRFVNNAFVETFGIGEETAYSPDFQLDRLFDPSSASLARGRIMAWERGDEASPMEVLGKDAAGQIRHLELRGSRIEFRGRPAAECLLFDMTEARRLRERLVEAEKLTALGELAGGVAHDFNNLLGAILGRTQLLRRRGFEGDVDRELAVIEKAAQDGRETVRRIQEFSRTRRDRKFTTVDLSEIMRDCVEITRTRWKDEAERKNIGIRIAVKADGNPVVHGNAAELREVFTNLILNAVDAMPQGGDLTLCCWERGDRVIAEARDTGVGMTEEIRRHLFDPFFTTKGQSGTGLGMSVVYGIVTRHGGKIDVETSLGRGTRFILDLPTAEEGIEVKGGDGAAMPQLVRPGRILVIDDEPGIAELLKDVLVAEGHTVEIAMCGTEGLKLADVSSYDLVFTDLGMPDMSGWEVAEKLREKSPRMPVVLVTGWGASLDEDEVGKAGIAAVVHKPFEIDELLRTTVTILSPREAPPAEAAGQSD